MSDPESCDECRQPLVYGACHNADCCNFHPRVPRLDPKLGRCEKVNGTTGDRCQLEPHNGYCRAGVDHFLGKSP